MAKQVKTGDELQKELEAANNQISTLTSKLTELGKQPDFAAEFESQKVALKADYDAELTKSSELVQSLREEIATKDSLILQLKKDVSEATDLIEEQHKRLSAETTESEHVHVTFKGTKYRVAVHAFNNGGTEVKAADLKDDKELIERLVTTKSGILVPVK